MTNGDAVRKMTNDELEEWFWAILDISKRYTSSKTFLHEWLMNEIIDDGGEE